MPKIKPEIWLLDELIESFESQVPDLEYNANRNIKNPKLKRQYIRNFNWGNSLLHYLKELQKLQENEQVPQAKP